MCQFAGGNKEETRKQYNTEDVVNKTGTFCEVMQSGLVNEHFKILILLTQ